jgi:hypothetical protein
MLDHTLIVLAIAFDMSAAGPYCLLHAEDLAHAPFRFLPVECHKTCRIMLAIEGYYASGSFAFTTKRGSPCSSSGGSPM